MGDQPERALLEIRNLRTYVQTRAGTVRAVNGVDLTVREGRTLCVVGESGSGKSLTALSVMGLIDKPVHILPGSEVWFGGRDLTAMPQRELTGLRGDELSMIFQDPMSSLNPLFSVGSQIAETVRRHTRAGRRQAWDRAVEPAPAGRRAVTRHPRPRLPPPAVRRDAAAGDDRDGAELRTPAADRR